MAYVPPPKVKESMRNFKDRIYNTFRTIAAAASEQAQIRVIRKQPNTRWDRVWKNLHFTAVSSSVRTTWFLAIHDVIPTKERLATIGITESNLCTACDSIGSLRHRINRCGEGPVIWNWTLKKIAAILQKDTRQVPEDWTLQPDFHIQTPSKHAAILWILAHLTAYRLQEQKHLSLQDYVDFLRMASWKIKTGKNRHNKMGHILDTL
jgi:hypothetical protein